VAAVLEYLPYRKRGGTEERDALTHPWFAARGYACLRVDIRGNGESDGLMDGEYTAQELADGVEVIDWIASQDWCSGAVGMMGISWGGFNALQIAALQPEPLKAIITLCSTDDRYADDIHYKGGCLLNENLGWGAVMFAYSSRPPDPAVVGDRWRDMWLERLEAEPLLPAEWLRHQTRDRFWKHGSVCEDYSLIKTPTLAIGGWGDAYKNSVARLVTNLSVPTKGIIGPWTHKYPHFAKPHPQIGFLQEALRWWDRWLKGLDTGVEADPAMRAYLMDSVRPQATYEHRAGRWIGSNEWPPNHSEKRTFQLCPNGTLLESVDPSGQDDLGVEISSPQDCGADGGEYCPVWQGPDMPGDQRRDDALSACFDTEPLTADLAIVGAPEVELVLRVDATSGQIAVRLNDVWPDGTSTRITYGVLNLCHRDGSDPPQALVAGSDTTVRLKLDDVAYSVPAGHRLRLSVSTAYWPLIWPSAERAVVTLSKGKLVLQHVASGDSDDVVLPPAESAPAHKYEALRASSNSRIVERDQATGRVTTTIIDDFGATRDVANGLEVSSSAVERWTIHADDPLSAVGDTEWKQSLSRGSWETSTITKISMRSDGENFYIDAHLAAFEGTETVFERTWEETIPRNFM
ncbi:MAG: CocE/NonD family hydrolase, partial [Actinobacteria bacterium]|nr:CocE/NonD family hydrolase [Actinomycetota bacterium]